MTRPEGLTTSLYSLGAKLFVSVCMSKLIAKYLAPLGVDTFLLNLGVSGEFDPWYLCEGKTTATLHLKPSTWGNQRGARSHQAKFSGAVAGDSTLQDKGVARYLLPLLLVLLVYLSVFALVSFIKNHKKIIYLSVSSPFCLAKHVRIWCFEGIRSSRFPSKGWRQYEEGMGQNF